MFEFASAWEQVAQQFPRRTALIDDSSRVSWQEYQDRAARLAALLQDNGVTAGSKVGLYLHNSNAYQEAQFGIFKVGACPINVNYRYKADELVYLLDNSDTQVLFYQACYAMRIWEIKDRLPNVRLYVQVDDGTEALMKFAVDYERAIVEHTPLPPQSRDPEGVYMLYTGGTTGLPKGVMYPVGAFARFLLNMGAASRELAPPQGLEDYAEFLTRVASPPVSLPACPLMHGTGVWLGSFLPQLLGGTVVTTNRLGLNPDRLWGLVEEHRVSDMVIVGDAFARPLLQALNDAADRGEPYELGSLQQMTSSGVMWSSQTKQELLAHHDMRLVDVFGSTEGGMGSSVTTRDGVAETASFELNEGVAVFTDDGRRVVPGSGERGRLATSALVPLGYYKDPEKSDATFREIDGVRYSFPGDYATVEADGSITLLGRGSACINTGGEKVFPEEVEEVVKQCDGVFDCLVVGVADERFGERVVAVASARPGLQADAVIEFCRSHLAGYKVPRQVVFVEEVKRAVNGKADYKWARSVVS